jgi:hypothetical protein
MAVRQLFKCKYKNRILKNAPFQLLFVTLHPLSSDGNRHSPANRRHSGKWHFFINEQNKLRVPTVRALFLDNTCCVAQRRGKCSHRA